jgi:membrane protein YdbS with pleckstrin-like domain
MSRAVDRAAEWVYRGTWGILAGWFKVPVEPPHLPAWSDDTVETFRPAPQYLRYLKLKFWVLLVAIDLLIIVPWLVVLIIFPVVGLLIALPVWAIAIVPDIIAYAGLHIRYDTMWYALSGRSMRLRRGLWVIHETTITYENIQNVTVHQGPLQRYFGIATLVVKTAGGGGSGPGKGGPGMMGGHVGIIEGIADVQQIRDLIMSRARTSRTTGLGDEQEHAGSLPRGMAGTEPGWTDDHIRVLREIRAAARAMESRMTASG